MSQSNIRGPVKLPGGARAKCVCGYQQRETHESSFGGSGSSSWGSSGSSWGSSGGSSGSCGGRGSRGSSSDGSRVCGCRDILLSLAV